MEHTYPLLPVGDEMGGDHSCRGLQPQAPAVGPTREDGSRLGCAARPGSKVAAPAGYPLGGTDPSAAGARGLDDRPGLGLTGALGDIRG